VAWSERFISYSIEDEHSLILEGWQLLPGFLAEIPFAKGAATEFQRRSAGTSSNRSSRPKENTEPGSALPFPRPLSNVTGAEFASGVVSHPARLAPHFASRCRRTTVQTPIAIGWIKRLLDLTTFE
jgi:hypothetical protein